MTCGTVIFNRLSVTKCTHIKLLYTRSSASHTDIPATLHIIWGVLTLKMLPKFGKTARYKCTHSIYIFRI